MPGTIFQIEQAMIDRVKLVNTVANFGGLIKTVDRYSGQFADENDDRLIEMCPFVLVSHTGSQRASASSVQVNWDGEFTVVCGAASMRTQTLASRVGGPAAQELGSRQLAELVRDLLAGQSLGLPIRNLMPLSIDEVYSGTPDGASGQHRLSVTGVRFDCGYYTQRSTAGDGGDVAQLLEIHADWVQPGTPAPTTLPVSPAPDFQSDVQFGGSST